MKLFHCDRCGQVLFFENSRCNSCQSALGYVPEAQRLVVIPDTPELSTPFPLPALGNARFVRCRNYWERQACNWLAAAPEAEEGKGGGAPYCRSCQLTEIIPDLSDNSNRAAWADIERAKRRLLYTLYALELPVCSRVQEPESGVGFRFLRGTKREPVMTGHSGGIITLNVAEAHAAYRENTREKLGEAYRTVLGHLRHEIGHYYWDRLIAGGPALDACRARFGDERQDYQQSVQRHYEQGPPASWADSFISAYATMHPWEDWAETWAHYLHMHDTLETAKSHGVAVRMPDRSGERVATDELVFRDFDGLAGSWQALTLTLNSLSRSMGLPDAYPFVLSQPVQEKLRFVHGIIHERRVSKSAPSTPAKSKPALSGAAAGREAASERTAGETAVGETAARETAAGETAAGDATATAGTVGNADAAGKPATNERDAAQPAREKPASSPAPAPLGG